MYVTVLSIHFPEVQGEIAERACNNEVSRLNSAPIDPSRKAFQSHVRKPKGVWCFREGLRQDIPPLAHHKALFSHF